MTQICHNMPKLNLRLRIKSRVLTLRRCFRCLWDRILICSLRKPVKYRMLTRPASSAASSPAPPSPYGDLEEQAKEIPPPVCRQSHSDKKDSDNLVPLKISMLGDSKVGKTSFLIKYIGDAKDEQEIVQEKGLNLVDKTLFVRGGRARLSYSIWDVDGGEKSPENILLACKDSVAILFMFDLTSRCTLTSVINWYQRARKMNQTAIPIMIGTKFDDFIQLPIDLQWTLASQARAYAKALNATLFFSSAEYNINVNKVFKFITAKLFDLPWTVERNLNIGEPIIDY